MEEDKLVDPQVQRGLARIEQFDRILKIKLEREKQVKRQGRRLRKQIQIQLMEVIQTPDMPKSTTHLGSQLPSATNLAIAFGNDPNSLLPARQEIVQNIERFLAIDTDRLQNSLRVEALPIGDSTEAHENLSDLCNSHVTAANKLFQTECNLKYEQFNGKKEMDYDSERCANLQNDIKASIDNDQTVRSLPMNTEVSRTHHNLEQANDPCQNDKNYIRRNAELACKAGEVLPRTDSEEARLEKLLAEEDNLDESPFGFPIMSLDAWVAESNDEAEAVSNHETWLSHQNAQQVLEMCDLVGTDQLRWSTQPASQPSSESFTPRISTKSTTNITERMMQIDNLILCLANERRREVALPVQVPESDIHLTNSDNFHKVKREDDMCFPKFKRKSKSPGEKVLCETQQMREDMNRLTEINQCLEVIQQENYEQMELVQLVLEKMNCLVRVPEKEHSVTNSRDSQGDSAYLCENNQPTKTASLPSRHTEDTRKFDEEVTDLLVNHIHMSARCTLGRSEPNICTINSWSDIPRPSTTDCYFGSPFYDQTLCSHKFH
ncbi:hypothetical protein D915_008073 [Fasciola hepatica]|uniref:Fibrous sheath-interacting protein 1 n=1 Tax=Fasciola hepatica TaxID=6192 RepID=A0A4E0RYA7_FASHE|nr:hypothetical protein D915_008073 [Fasciola hepatica]